MSGQEEPPRLLLSVSAEVREHLAEGLRQTGFDVAWVESPQELAARVRMYRPSLVFVEAESFEACRSLRADAALGDLAVLCFLRAGSEPELADRALEAGANDVLAEPYTLPVLAARVRGQIAVCEANRLREKVIRDELTGVFSRRYLFESMRQHVAQFSRPGPPVLSCLMVDVDHFKAVNDRYGHLEGDRILRRIAETVYTMTRKGDVVARFGGEEFVVVLPSTDADGAVLVAEKLRRAVADECRDEGVTISIGVAWYTTPEGEYVRLLSSDEAMDSLLRKADEALYRAKREGRNRVCTMREASGEERRQQPRVSVAAEAEFVLPGGIGLRRTVDLSPGGICVNDVSGVEVGDRVEMVLHLSGYRVEVVGRVAWTVHGGQDRVGIAFESFGRRSQEILNRHLGHVALLRGAPRRRSS